MQRNQRQLPRVPGIINVRPDTGNTAEPHSFRNWCWGYYNPAWKELQAAIVGAAVFCPEPYQCCAECMECCSIRCGWIDDSRPEKREEETYVPGNES